jgi:hypothetical protein
VRSRIRQPGVLRSWQSEELVGRFFSSSPQWACLLGDATTYTYRAL